jgi:hypothetical protein
MKKYTEEIAIETKDPKILTEILRKGKDDKISWCAVKNPNCPSVVLVEILKRKKDDYVSMYAAENPNCPPEILVKILKKGRSDGISLYAVSNPNCPPEMLAEILRRGKDDNVSWHTYRNKNCPKDAKIKWNNDMNSIRKIQNYLARHSPSFDLLIEAQKMIEKTLKNIEK